MTWYVNIRFIVTLHTSLWATKFIIPPNSNHTDTKYYPHIVYSKKKEKKDPSSYSTTSSTIKSYRSEENLLQTRMLLLYITIWMKFFHYPRVPLQLSIFMDAGTFFNHVPHQAGICIIAYINEIETFEWWW